MVPSLFRVLALSLAVLFSAVPAVHAQSMTSTDVERLQDATADASRELAQLRATDSAKAASFEKQLDALRDETIYLKVKLGKNESVPRTDYFELRDRIDALRAEMRKAPEAGLSVEKAPANSTPAMDVPPGAELDVKLASALSSATAAVEDRVSATTLVALEGRNRTLIPAGSTLSGVVTSVNKAGRIERKGSLTVNFDRITINNTSYPIQATVTQALESEGVRGEAGRIGTGAGVGAIIGGILGGFKGALAGILIGGGGTVAATDGKDVDLPAGTVLRVRIDSGLDLR